MNNLILLVEKIFIEPDIMKKGDSGSYQIYVSVLDYILTNMNAQHFFILETNLME